MSPNGFRESVSVLYFIFQPVKWSNNVADMRKKTLKYLFSLISTGIYSCIYKLHTQVVVAPTFLYNVNPEVDLSCKIC